VNGYLVDTNILSELTKPTPAPQVESFLRQSRDRVFVSVFSSGEIRKDIASLPASNRRAALQDWLDNRHRHRRPVTGKADCKLIFTGFQRVVSLGGMAKPDQLAMFPPGVIAWNGPPDRQKVFLGIKNIFR
jgi:hypothetical protein